MLRILIMALCPPGRLTSAVLRTVVGNISSV